MEGANVSIQLLFAMTRDIPEERAPVRDGHVLQSGVALGSELRRLQLLPHQRAKGLVVRARSSRIRAGLWRHSIRGRKRHTFHFSA